MGLGSQLRQQAPHLRLGLGSRGGGGLVILVAVPILYTERIYKLTLVEPKKKKKT